MAGVVVALALGGEPAAAQESRLAASWTVMVDACVAFAETGERGVFDGWETAFPGGGVCNGDPACEGDDMTFIAPGEFGSGAVTVRVGRADWVGQRHFGGGEDRVASFPAHFFCASAEGTAHATADILAAHEDWVARAVAEGRLRPALGFVSAEAGPYVGCGWDGRPFVIEFSLMRPGPAVLRLNYPARVPAADGRQCAGVAS
ncbi:hypothetical protein [Oceaniglobus roseus]|uniref:hypothetical protein n=1 Tax=Oceaniglobus roseus TaxID=1737570 RepID=UPI0012FFEB8E|nr:hypothetical protein [Kandeliimicrobium roseum]